MVKSLNRFAWWVMSASLLTAVAMSAEPLPFRLYDTHTHFVTADFARYPLNIPAPLPGVAPNPATANLAERVTRSPTDAATILRLWDSHGVEAGVGVQYRTAYGTDNTYLLDSSGAHQRRVASVVLLDPFDANTPYIIRSMVRDARAAGVRFSGSVDQKTGEYPWLTAPLAQKIWRAANDLGIVIVLMPVPPNAPDPKVLAAIAENARRYPNVRVVLDHFGWPNMQGAPDYGLTPAHLALKPLRNVYFKLSSINLEALAAAKLSSTAFVRHAVDTFGADRIMWGSDLGNTAAPYDELVELAIASTVGLTQRERRAVLHDTGKAVHVPGGRGRR
jgi:L-fuconolactonase